MAGVALPLPPHRITPRCTFSSSPLDQPPRPTNIGAAEEPPPWAPVPLASVVGGGSGGDLLPDGGRRQFSGTMAGGAELGAD